MRDAFWWWAVVHSAKSHTFVYGIGRASPRTFYTHHLAAISNAVVMADASTVTQFTNELAFKLSIGLPF